MEQKQKITKEQLSRMVNVNIQAGLNKAAQENALFLRDYYKMNQKMELNNGIKLIDKAISNSKLSKIEQEYLETLTDPIHNMIFDMKKQYRKMLEKQFEVVEA
jgi:predicted DNA-binding protein (UPF0278 family)